MIEEYNVWRKKNPHGSILDFCKERHYPVNLDTVTEILSLSRVIETDFFTPEIELNIRNEIIKAINSIDEDTVFEIVTGLKEEIEENLENLEVEFEYEETDFTYSYTYNLEARAEDVKFNEFINYKAEQSETFKNFLHSRQERSRQFLMSKYASTFLQALSDAINKGLDVYSSFSLTYEGFTFHYNNVAELPKIFYDEQIQKFIESSFAGFKNYIEVDQHNPQKNNINTHIQSFNFLINLIETYDEAVAKDAMNGIDLELELDDQVMEINQQIMDLIIDRFDHVNVNNDLTAEQFKAITTAIISDISVNMSDHLNNIVIENSFDSKVIPLEFLHNCGAGLNTLVKSVITNFKDKITSWPIQAKICFNNDLYQTINQEIKKNQNYQDTKIRFSSVVEQNDLLNIHRFMSAITHAIDGKYLKAVEMPYAHDTLVSALKETSYYHKTFVLRNNVDTLIYQSKNPTKSASYNIRDIFERLQYTGRSFMREIVRRKEEPIIDSRKEDISKWQEKILSSSQNIKSKININTLNDNIARYKEDIINRENKIAKPIPSLKAPNFSIPTFMFTVGYKDVNQNTLKREFIEIPILKNGPNIASYTHEEKFIIDTIRTRDEQAFRDNIQEQIDDRGLPEPHGYDSERIFSYYIRKPEVIQALVQNLREKVNVNGFLNISGNTCKIYAATILSYSTNATCRNCTRLYVALANDKNEGSFIDLLTKEIKKTKGLFAYDANEIKENSVLREGIRIRTLIIADHDYHEHQKFSKEHPETLVHHGDTLDIKHFDKKSFVEIVRQDIVTSTELHSGVSFVSGRNIEVRYVNNIYYDSNNLLLHFDELLYQAGQIGGIATIDNLIQLGEDREIAEAIIDAVREYSINHVLTTIFSKEASKTQDAQLSLVDISNNAATANNDEYFVLSDLFIGISSSWNKIINSDISWQYKKTLYGQDIMKFNNILKKNSINKSIDVLKDKSDFRKSILLKLHPDKGGNTQDFIFVKELREKLNKDINIKEIIDDKLQSIQPIIHKTNIGFKALDTAADAIRLFNEPNLSNIKKFSFDFNHLYGMYSGLNGYSLVLTGADSLYQCYQGEYYQALNQIATTASYMALPTVISFAGVPYIGFAYGSLMAVFTGYHAVNNAYSLYSEYGSIEWQLKSAIAYNELYKFLANSPLQYTYNFASNAKWYEIKANSIKLEIEKTQIKQQLEAKGEFGNKLYDYIHVPILEEKYNLLNKIISGELTEEQAAALKAKHISMTISEQYYEHCMEVRNDVTIVTSEEYYCYNENQQILDHVVLGKEGIVLTIDRL